MKLLRIGPEDGWCLLIAKRDSGWTTPNLGRR